MQKPPHLLNRRFDRRFDRRTAGAPTCARPSLRPAPRAPRLERVLLRRLVSGLVAAQSGVDAITKVGQGGSGWAGPATGQVAGEVAGKGAGEGDGKETRTVTLLPDPE